nr:diacylglycerol kinase family protein [uncultured Anaeromusa sp.]
MFREIWVIYNDQAGWHKRKKVEDVIAALAEKQVQMKLCRTAYAGHAELWAAEACRQGVELLVVAGGDGTLNEAINGLYKEPPESWPLLAVYPSGTINLIAEELTVPKDAQRFIDILWQRRIVTAWPGIVNERYFLANVGAGFDGWVVHRVKKSLKRWVSKWAYAWQLLLLLVRIKWRRSYKVTVDGIFIANDASAVVVAKGRYYAGVHHAAYEARLDKKNLYVCVFQKRSIKTIFEYIRWLSQERLPQHPDVRICTAEREVIIQGGGNGDRQMDGDIFSDGVLNVTMADHPIRIIGSAL